MPDFIDPDPEPNIDEDPTGWMKWSRRQDQRQAALDRQRQDFNNLNSFGLAAEATARQQVPDYDQAMEFLRLDYRRELEESGELDEAAMPLLADPAGRQNVLAHAAQKGLSEVDAARDLCAMGAWEWRRQRIVAAQRRMGGNPALKAVEMAKRRGYKAGLSNRQPTLSSSESGESRRMTVGAQSILAEPAREPTPTPQRRVLNRQELDALPPKARAEEIRRIAAAMDDEAPLTPLSNYINLRR